jgi:uncharacterized protein YxeA
MKKLLLSIIILILMLQCSFAFAMSTDEILKYKGQYVTIVQDYTVIPYTTRGVLLDVIKSRTGYYAMVQTYRYYDYSNGIAFIDIDNICYIK